MRSWIVNPSEEGDMNEATITRLVDNANIALKNAKSEWGKNYWESVLRHLLRKYSRMM